MTESGPVRPVILVVDDSRVIRRAASKMLSGDYEVIEAVDGADAWDILQRNESVSVVFTDIQMPNMNGMELLANVRECENERIAGMPVIMITGQDDTEAVKKRVFKEGATDFISKPFQSIDLISRAKSYAVLNRKVVELEKQSGHDKLTGLFNGASFEEQGKKAVSFAQRHKMDLSIVLLEIENFQQIFLSHGKSVAQQIIVEVSKRLVESLRVEDVAARIGVSRFALLLPITSLGGSRKIVTRISAHVAKLVFNTGREKLRVKLVSGIGALGSSVQDDFDALVKQAESSMGHTELVAPERIASVHPVLPMVTDADIQKAFNHILLGEYNRIPQSHLKAVVDRLAAFMHYVECQNSDQRRADGGGVS